MSSPFVPRNLDEALRLADVVAASRMFGLASPERAFVLMAAAAALGFEPLQGLAGMRDVDGRPCPSADMLVAACLRHPSCERFIEIECTDQSCTWTTTRNGVESRETFSMTDAARAGLGSGTAWKKYPRKMLSARAKAALARRVFPDVCFGMYTPDELGETDIAATSAAPIRAQIEAPIHLPPLPKQLAQECIVSEPPTGLDAIRLAQSKDAAKAAAIAAHEAGLDKEEIKNAYIARLKELGQ